MAYTPSKIVEASFVINDRVNDEKLVVEYDEIEYKVLRELIDFLEYLGYDITNYTVYE